MNTTDGRAQPPPLPPRLSATSSKSDQELIQPPVPHRGHQNADRPHSASDVAGREQQLQEENITKKPTIRPRAKSPISGGDDDNMAAHYAYLQRHVRGVKRTQVAGLKAPELKNFIVQSNDDGTSNNSSTRRTKWREFIEAWIQYIVQSFASGQVDDDLEPFSLKIVRSGADRLFRLALPLESFAVRARKVYRWENRWATGFLAMSYLSLWYCDFIVPFFVLGIIAYCVYVRVDMLAQFGVEALATTTNASISATDAAEVGGSNSDGEEGDSGGSHIRQFWRRLKHDLGPDDVHEEDTTLFEKRSLNEWWGEIKRMYGPKGQLILLDTVDRLERVKNLITWKRPEKTRKLLCLLSVAVLFFMILPSRYVTKLFFLYIGIEFFALQALRSHYPTHRRLFNIIDWILWGVPNDAEYAMDVIRLHRMTTEVEPRSPITSTQDKRNSAPQHPLIVEDSLQSAFTAAADAADPTVGQQSKPKSSAAATLAMMVAGAAIGQAKMAIDEKLYRTHTSFSEEGEQSLSQLKEINTATGTGGAVSTAVRPAFTAKDLLERKGSQGVLGETKEIEGGVVETYGCAYKGNIPGRLVLTKNGLQFRTSRVTGARVLVYYYWRDIVSVRKTKSIDMLVWHTNGLSIKTVDGEELFFENVIKRDDCFNSMVSVAGDHWR